MAVKPRVVPLKLCELHTRRSLTRLSISETTDGRHNGNTLENSVERLSGTTIASSMTAGISTEGPEESKESAMLSVINRVYVNPMGI